ncbi:MAG: hypothetical protein KKI02_07755 [Planctomycetes bacterium]|nr:hypothetical protein [Planctomycetota bacterium]
MTPSFKDDLAFLKQHTDVIVLGDDEDGPRVAVVPQYQGRVMTSTTGGPDAAGFGWINNELIASGEIKPHINVFGGEDRFWLGPEGGQFSIFFKSGDKFDLEDWQTPAVIDTVPYKATGRSAREVSFRHETRIVNYSGTQFDVRIDRTIRLIDDERCAKLLGLQSMPDVETVAYESDNTLTNRGNEAWTKDGGALSIWILGMFRHSDETTVVIPYRTGSGEKLGPIVNDAYFGKVPADRLVVSDGVMYFKGDGKYRSKIGVLPQRATGILGSYDAAGHVLTIAQYTQPAGVTDYVNSMWELQEHPFAGDAVNSYNDGPPAPGKPPLGPFYELETSSPAAFLAPSESITHVHRTFHFQGDPDQLDKISRAVLGVSTDQIAHAFD